MSVKIAKLMGFRCASLLIMTCFSIFIFIASLAGNFSLFLVLYGIVPPFISGIVYMLPIHCCWAYFPEHKAKVTGVINTAFGFSASLFNYISTLLVNPDNLDPTIIV